MDKRFLELVWEDYLDSIRPVDDSEFEINTNIDVNDEIKEKILKMFSQPVDIKPKEKPPIEPGNVYLMFKDGIPIYFVVYEVFEDGWVEVLKMSNYWELANQNDLITRINDEIFAVETWNNFYLTEEEIKNTIYYGKLNKEDFKLLVDFVEDKISELPEGKRGLKVPLKENYLQIKFHNKESELVKEFKLRLFTDVLSENIIELSPEREEEVKLSLVAGKEKTLVKTDKFIIKVNKSENLFEIIPLPEFVGKKAVVKIFDDEFETESLPEKFFVKPKSDIKNIDLEKLSKNIEVEIVESN